MVNGNIDPGLEFKNGYARDYNVNARLSEASFQDFKNNLKKEQSVPIQVLLNTYAIRKDIKWMP